MANVGKKKKAAIKALFAICSVFREGRGRGLGKATIRREVTDKAT